ncbi:MAG: hypothetical protein QOJ19_212 [Acidimicrobiia bacterium]|nr:hypothetical protein [Acidimicrobiia bacterium]
MTPSTPRVSPIPALSPDGGDHTFVEAWHAEAFALALGLMEAGVFSSAEWTDALSSAISTAAQAADSDDTGDTYYGDWLRALETLCARKGVTSPAAVEARASAWRDAYLNTLHGRPVELPAAGRRLRGGP